MYQISPSELVRSHTQAGYRPQLGTMHHASAPCTFTLQHVVDKHKHARKPLYLCFVDSKSAYDKVQWQLLWQLLQRLGVHGDMLSAIRSLYDGCLLSMRVSGSAASGSGHNPSMALAYGRVALSVQPFLASSLKACTNTFTQKLASSCSLFD